MQYSMNRQRRLPLRGTLLIMILAIFTHLRVCTAGAVIDPDIGEVIEKVPQSVIPARGLVVSERYIGLHVHHSENFRKWPVAQVRAWRLWDAYSTWRDIEPQNGKWDFAKLDFNVRFAERFDIEILLPLGSTPQWASARPDESCAYGKGCAAEPRELNDWRKYVRMVATRYKGKIKRYEIWNEVNLKIFYSGSLEALFELHKAAYEELKSVDPENILISPSMAGNNQSEIRKLDRYLALGAGKYSDAISYHLYVPKSRPEAMVPLALRIFQIMDAHGLNHKPLWNTESGWLIENSDGTPIPSDRYPDWLRLDDDQATSFLARSYILVAALGVERFYWFAWDNSLMGLSEPTTRVAKKSGMALGKVADWLVGSRPLGCKTAADAIWICEFEMANGDVGRAIWSSRDEVQDMAIPDRWEVKRIENLDGKPSDTLNQRRIISVSSQPVFLF